MAAIIGLEEGLTREVCEQAGVELANLNCPGQIVISGEADKLNAACELAKAKGAKKAMPLAVAGAYHSKLMASAQPKLREALLEVSLNAPTVPVVSNVTAQPHSSGKDSRRSRTSGAGTTATAPAPKRRIASGELASTT